MFFRTDYSYQRNIVDKAQKMQFGVAKEDKMPRGYGFDFRPSGRGYCTFAALAR